MARKRKRKQYLVEKNVQGALGFRIALHWFVFMSISVMITTFLKMSSNFDQPTLWQGFLSAIQGQSGMICVLLGLLPWFVHDSLKLSNRFAGPMVRLKQSIIELTNGDEDPPVSFRKSDFWQDIATDFNELRSKVLADRRQLSELQAGMTSAQADVSSDSGTTKSENCVLPFSTLLPTNNSVNV